MRKAIAVIGEGITEKYYIESLKGLTAFDILPKTLNNRASSLKDLEKVIKSSIKEGYDEVYCLIDMDNKCEGTSKEKYYNLKSRYNNSIFTRKKDGVKCEVHFIETERCTELWFLYHFTKTAITRKFTSYSELQIELRKYRPQYDKTEKYFRSIVDLNKEMTEARKPYGSLENALNNAESSIKSRNLNGRTHTYCEMHLLLNALGIKHK